MAQLLEQSLNLNLSSEQRVLESRLGYIGKIAFGKLFISLLWIYLDHEVKERDPCTAILLKQACKGLTSALLSKRSLFRGFGELCSKFTPSTVLKYSTSAANL